MKLLSELFDAFHRWLRKAPPRHLYPEYPDHITFDPRPSWPMSDPLCVTCGHPWPCDDFIDFMEGITDNEEATENDK